DTGLPEAQVVEIVGLVDAFVRGLARATVAEATDKASSGQSNDEYWTSLSSFWVDYFDVDRYPTMTRIWNAGGFDAPDHDSFTGPLERLLDAVGSTIDRARER